jgi:hypothetical protein
MEPLRKLHNIIVHIRSPAPRTKQCEEISGKRIELGCRTRWNSWYTMLQTTIKLESSIGFYIKSYPDLEKDCLNPMDWNIVRTIVFTPTNRHEHLFKIKCTLNTSTSSPFALADLVLVAESNRSS